jgi:hypothetical protein
MLRHPITGRRNATNQTPSYAVETNALPVTRIPARHHAFQCKYQIATRQINETRNRRCSGKQEPAVPRQCNP